MRTTSSRVSPRGLISLLVLFLVALVLPAQQEQSPEDLIKQLGSAKFNERTKAGQTLENMGAKALPALREAAKDKDPEVSRRAAELVQRIEKKGQLDQLLEPTYVTLSHQNATVKEVVADLARQAGYTIKLDKKVDAQKQITLRTGRVPFWQAFDELCKQADLVLAPITVKAPAVVAQEPQLQMRRIQKQIQQQGGNVQIIMPQLELGEEAKDFEKVALTLMPGKPLSSPTSYNGALRVRAIPVKEAENERIREHTAFLIEACAEPKIAWRGPLELRSDKLTDNLGQQVEVTSVELSNQKSPDGDAAQEMAPGLPFNQQLVVLIRTADKPGKSLPELNGVLAGQVQGPNLPVISIPDVTKAGTKPHKSNGGDELSVLAMRTLDAGQVELQVELKTNEANTGNGQQVFQGNIQIQIGGNFVPGKMQGRILGGNPFRSTGASPTEVQLYDDKGKPYSMSVQNLNARTGNGQKVSKMTLICEPPREGAKPGKLVYATSRPTSFEVPIRLKDVPLP